MNSKIIGDRIKLLMTMSKMPVTKLAKELDMSYKTLMRKLNGESEFCNADIIKLQKIFDLSLELFSNIFFNSNFDLKERLDNKKKSS
ncbi:MAG: hypothetical protein HFJ58_00330 [Clostridia bacterium]|nr:hypothetical protein [Clostridia bacterium]